MKGIDKGFFRNERESTTASYHRGCIKHDQEVNTRHIYTQYMSSSSVLIISTFSSVSPLIGATLR